MIRHLFIVAFCLFVWAAVNAEAQSTAPPMERLETGFASAAGHAHVPYSIRLMPVSSFPQLPAVVAQRLNAMGCMIPQTYEAREPENVLHGSFEKAGSSDWAALCSVDGVSTLYVFFQSNSARPIALRHQPDSLWLGREWGEGYGSAWGIATRPARLMRPTEHAVHDAIEDSFVEQSRTIHYFENGQWVTLDPGQ